MSTALMLKLVKCSEDGYGDDMSSKYELAHDCIKVMRHPILNLSHQMYQIKYYKSTFSLQNCLQLKFLIEIGWFWVCWIQQYIISGRKEVSRHSVSYIISITLVVNTTLFIHINKNNIVLSSSDRNFALAHFMKEMQCFPEGTDVKRVMDLYFQVCE